MRFALSLVCALLFLLGCQVADGPELLAVSQLGPRTVSAGDRIEILGKGFPEGRRAQVVLRGERRRPGRFPIENTEIELAGFAHSATRLTVSIDDEAASRFVGPQGTAGHTTFHGDVRVIFPSRTASAPAVMGTLRAVTLDVVPVSRGAATEEHEARGRRLIAHLGVVAEPATSPGPLRIGAILPSSLAERAGLRPGDSIASAQGVTVRTVADLAMPRGLRTLTLWIVRPNLESPFEVEIDVEGLSPPSPRDLGPAGVVLGILVVLFCLLWGPLPRVAAWIERGVLVASRASGSGRRRSRTEQLLTWLSPPGEAHLRGAVGAPLGAFVVTVGAFSWIGSGRALVSPQFDLPILYGLSIVALVAGRMAEGGERNHGSWSLLLGLWSVVQTLLFLLPGALAVAALIFASESVAIAEIARAQGGSPWRWWGLTNPGLCVSAAVFMLTAVPMGVRGHGRFAALEGPQHEHGSRTVVFARACEWLHAWVTAALAVCLFFGAFQVPLASAVWSPSIFVMLVGHVLFVAKLWLCMLFVAAGRALASRLGVEALLGFAITRALPAALLSLAISVVWAEGAQRLELTPATAGMLLFGVVLSTAFYVLSRLRSLPHREPLSGTVNPWL